MNRVYYQITDEGAAAMSGSGKPDTIAWNDLTVLQQIAIMRIHNGERPLMQIFDQLCHMGLCGVRNGDEYYLSNHALDLYRNYLSSPTAAREAEVTRLTAENGRLREALGDSSILLREASRYIDHNSSKVFELGKGFKHWEATTDIMERLVEMSDAINEGLHLTEAALATKEADDAE